MSDQPSILYARDGAVAIITLNRPDRMNAMDQAMLAEINAAVDKAEADDGVRAIALTGAGKGFSSGFDLKAQAANPPQGVDEWRPVLRRDFDTTMRFWHCPKPTVAAVHGPALAGACEMSLACDVTIASTDAVFGEPELKFGAGIVTMILPWIAGPKIAKEIILTGEDGITAQRAYEIGMVNKLVEPGAHLSEAISMAKRMAAMEPGLTRETKRAINKAYELMGIGEALEAALDIDLTIEGRGTETKREFLRIAREQGLRAAISWRDERLAGE